MEIRQLRYFIAIVNQGSLSSAVNVLHIAQPALSHQLSQLETELGTRLLHRSAQGVKPTEAGLIFYEHAQTILRQIDNAKAAVSVPGSTPSGSVALGVPASASPQLALPLLTAVKLRYPDIKLRLTEELTITLTEQLRSGRIDMAILFDDGQLSPFVAEPLADEPIMLLVGAESELRQAGMNEITLADASLMPLILPDRDQGVRPRIDRAVIAAGLTMADVSPINSLGIIKSMILANLGATLHPKGSFLDEIERGHLVAYRVVEPTISRRISIVHSRNIALSAAAEAVKALTLETASLLCQNGIWQLPDRNEQCTNAN